MHKDMLGQPLEVGDIIAWSVGASGSSAIGMTVGRIEKFGSGKPDQWSTGPADGSVTPSGFACWNITAMPIKSSYARHYHSTKAVHIKKVGNVLKLGTDLNTIKEVLDGLE